MATVNKDFKVKHGLVVEGSNATVNGNQVLTETASDQYIIDLIGGETLITSVESTQMEVVNGELNIKTGVFEPAGSIDALTTDDISEGSSNKYYTDSRVKDVLTGATKTNITIETIAGELHITAENGVADSDTDDLTEGTTNKYFTEARVRDALTGGDGISFNGSTGDISADVAGGLHIDNAQIKIDRTTVDAWYDAAGTAATEAGYVATDLSTHTSASSGVHGITGSVVGTTDAQTLSDKEFNGKTKFHAANGAGNLEINLNTSTGAATISNNNDDLTITTSGGDIILDPSGTAYVGSASAGNEIATNSYVDNAVSGLDWKNAAHVLYDAATPVLTATYSTTPLTVDGHLFGSGENGLRVLVTSGNDGGSDAGIYVYNHGTTWTLTRATDADVYTELLGAAIYIAEGTQYGGSAWVQNNPYLTDFSSQSWTQFSGSGTVTAGTGIIVDGLEVSVDTDVIATQLYADGAVGTHSDYTSNIHGVTGNVVGTTDSQILTNKTINDELYFTNPATQGNDGGIKIDNSNEDLVINAYTADLELIGLGDINLTSTNGDINLNPDGNVFINGSSAEHQVATQGYVDNQDTDDVSEGSTNQYFTAQRVRDVLTGSTQTNIVIEEIAGELIITAENGVEDSTTDDLEEGATNHYFTDERAKNAAADLLTNATKTNITITGTGSGLTITAENGVADSDTDDLDEGSTNLYFTDQRAIDALQDTTPVFSAVDIDSVAKQIAATVSAPTGGSQITAYEFNKADYRSAKFLVKTSYGSHTELSEVLITLDTSDNIAITEYAIVGTNGSSMAVTADVYGPTNNLVRLRVTPVNNNSTVTVMGTLLV